MRIEDEERERMREQRERMRELAREQVLRAEAERDAARERDGWVYVGEAGGEEDEARRFAVAELEVPPERVFCERGKIGWALWILPETGEPRLEGVRDAD